MNPLTIAAGAAGAAVLGYLGWKKIKGPTAEDYQSINVTGPNGVPVKIATPVATTITVAQATATPDKPLTVGPIVPVPTTVPGQGVTYAPPGAITAAPDGQGVLQPASIVITSAGASSVAIGSVKDVQHALNTLGYAKPPLVEDGILGPKTIAAVRSFQSKNNLVVDGNAGPATKGALSKALTQLAGGISTIGVTVQNSNTQTGTVTTSAGAVIDTTQALTMTTKGIQHILNLLGATPKLDEDGKLGPKTVAAIKSFQTAHGLTSDGIAGTKTKTALYLATAQVVR
jgi:peptidoglycan hydrolase-like protein with peptidoglycan-binding domain